MIMAKIADLGGPIVSGASGLLGSVVGAFTQRSANRTNLKINQMNNDFNREEAEKARAFQEKMWNKENEYNTPAAQRKRQEEAGFNPYMSGAESGNATGVSGTNAASAGSPIGVQPYTGEGFQRFGESIIPMLKALSEKQGQDIQNLNQGDLMRAQISQMLGNTNWANASPEARRLGMLNAAEYANLGMKRLRQQVANEGLQGDLTRALRINYLLDAKSKRVLNKYLDQQQQSDLNVKAAHYENLVLDGQMKPVQVRKLISEEVLNYARVHGQKISNRIAEQTADGYIRMMNHEQAYAGDMAFYRGQYSKEEAGYEVKSRRYKSRMDQLAAEQQDFNNRMLPWREAVNSANMLFHGAGSMIGSYTQYKNGKWLQGRPYYNPYDYDTIETFMPEADGGYVRNRSKIHRRKKK